MGSNVFFNCFFYLLVFYYISICAGHWITDAKFEMYVILSNMRFSNVTADVLEKSNQSDLAEQLIEKNSNNTLENATTFWAISDVSLNTTEATLAVQMDTLDTDTVKAEDKFDTLAESRNDTVSTNMSAIKETVQTDKNSSHELFTETDPPAFTMNEKIMLQRNNCHLEIAIPDTHDLKIEISFGKLENNASGKCCVTLYGDKNNMLGVLISNIHLYEDAFQGEVLKVITTSYGLDFVLKEYHSWSKYEPLLLTETHKVYLVLYYKVTNVSLSEEGTYFNLEVFSYHKFDNFIHYDYSQSGHYYK